MNHLSKSRAACARACIMVASAHAASIQQQPFAGVRYTHRIQSVPRLLSIHVVEIDLMHPEIRFLVSPSNGDAPGESTPRTVSQFVTSVGAQIGINTTFFSSAGGGGFNNSGLVASRGDVYSPFETGNSASPVLHISADNFAQILRRAGAPAAGTSTTPVVSLYNAVSGNERIVTNGRETAGTTGDAILLHPRTAAGITADRRLIFLVVDGRQTGFSLGMFNRELADLLIEYGAVDGVNLDGGGSSTLVFSDPAPRVLNRPSDGRERLVAASLGVFAAPPVTARDIFVFADFYAGDPEGFARTLDSASNAGILATSTATAVQSPRAVARGWFHQLTVRDDPAVTQVIENPDGGWLVRHGWSSTVEAAVRPARGFIGFWARTQDAGVTAALAVNASGAVIRSGRRPLIADGAWHLYEWNLQDASAWPAGPARGAGVPAGVFTLDSLQFFGPNQDAVIDLDLVSHNALGLLGPELAPMETGRLANLSVRSTLAANNPTLHLGITLAGAGERPLLLRAAGPALAALGVQGSATDPRLVVLDQSGTVMVSNDNWAGAPLLAAATTRVGAFPFLASSLDAAALAPLSAGNHFLQVSRTDAGAGTVLVEAYDAGETSAGPRLVNLSTRTLSGGDPLIVGFVVADGSRRVLIRAIGPALTSFGVTDALRDPRLSVYAGPTLHALNDDWGGGPVLTEMFPRVGAFGLASGSLDAAILLPLAPGAYTVHIQGATAAAGSVLLELYEVP